MDERTTQRLQGTVHSKRSISGSYHHYHHHYYYWPVLPDLTEDVNRPSEPFPRTPGKIQAASGSWWTEIASRRSPPGAWEGWWGRGRAGWEGISFLLTHWPLSPPFNSPHPNAHSFTSDLPACQDCAQRGLRSWCQLA